MIEKIISGGQWGADLAGIKVGAELGIPTGGMAPKGFKTKFGSSPKLSNYGLIEHPTSDSYPLRTAWNVENSDATIRFAENFKSAGEFCTLKFIKRFNKPHYDVDLNENCDLIFDILDFLEDNNVKVLNVAGNVGRDLDHSKAIFRKTKRILKNIIIKFNNLN